MKRIILIALLSLGFCSFAQKAKVITSQKPGWHKIGETTASFKVEMESIVLLGADKFKAIKLKVKDAPINLLTLTVTYETGETETIALKKEMAAGSESGQIKIKEISLSKVDFIYKTSANTKNDKAEVELYGLK